MTEKNLFFLKTKRKNFPKISTVFPITSEFFNPFSKNSRIFFLPFTPAPSYLKAPWIVPLFDIVRKRRGKVAAFFKILLPREHLLFEYNGESVNRLYIIMTS